MLFSFPKENLICLFMKNKVGSFEKVKTKLQKFTKKFK